ncbi:hypothetical protein Rhe02_43020 [Rhizocola hellebori]|uniref:Uncharacterized protein n=1 Tax=Rhizocola hellebori TaxID=1392758 RepID=A0A8J3VH82_9ACTN|nr:hypothetical protein [Rhizocola hellebori]GIH06235.1 hypothetical protein Rhe02_43020 [Rhizocola hellebori]
MDYAALVRPVIDRVYTGVRAAARPRTRQVVEEFGLDPGFIVSFYFGLLARPMPAEGFAAASSYIDPDMTDALAQGIATVDESGAWHLTDTGRRLALALQRAIGEGAEEFWAVKNIPTMPGLDALPRLADLLGKLLAAGAASGGPAFSALAPVYEPADASLGLQVTSRLGALRHHRADAHRAAWAAAGLTLGELRALPAESEQRQAIEADTNRRDAPIYEALDEEERWEFLALLGALPG